MVEWFGRPGIETDEAREHRISMEAFVDTYKLGVISADDETREAVEDWLYWGKKGLPVLSQRRAAERAHSASWRQALWESTRKGFDARG